MEYVVLEYWWNKSKGVNSVYGFDSHEDALDFKKEGEDRQKELWPDDDTKMFRLTYEVRLINKG